MYGNFDKFWRVRLDMIRVILLDEFNKPIPSPGSDLGGYIQIRITYPTTFNDTNLNNDKLAFLAQDFFCSADYFTNGDGISFFFTTLTSLDHLRFHYYSFLCYFSKLKKLKRRLHFWIELSYLVISKIAHRGGFFYFTHNQILSCNTSLRFSYLFSDAEFVSQCVVDDEFTDINYKPAPDGLFSIKLGNPDQLDVQKIQKIRIQFAGNSIPRDMKNIKWIE